MDEKARSRDTSEAGNWETIADDDGVWGPPATFPPPLDDPRPAYLNTHQMDWENFERLVMAIARQLDGAYDARRYGKRGQAQQGVDVVAFLPDRSCTVYSARRWQAFRPRDLERTVDEYLGGRRPFDAKRLVVAVGSEVRDTALIDKLDELRQKYPDARIDLWDQAQISERLRRHPHLVSTFFGQPTAEVFCGIPTRAVPDQPAEIASDAILRGPIAHLELSEDLARARFILEEDPSEAADALGTIAGRLTEAGFAPHSAAIRSLQAKAFMAAGRRAEEAEIRLDLGWFFFETGEPLLALEEARQVADWEEAVAEVDRRVDGLAAAARYRFEYSISLEDVAEAFDALPQDDPHRTDAALVLAEEAVAARRLDVVEKRADVLREMADAMPRHGRDVLIAARLRMCVADATGGWTELADSAVEVYPPPTAALIIARHARHLTLEPNGGAALARWRDAIERACLAHLNDDASDWLYAFRAANVLTGQVTGDLNEPHRHAQALRAAGSGRILPEPFSGRERALASMRDRKWPEAYTSLRRELWASTVRASWAAEIEAHERFGDLFAETGRREEAVEHYVWAGDRKKLEGLAASLPDKQVRLPIELRTPRPWERAAAYSFAAAAADLIADEDAREWCSAALAEIIDRPQSAGFGAPDPWLAAFKAFGALAGLSTEDEAHRFLGYARDLVPRRPNSYRFTDEDHALALIALADAHVGVREAALDQLVGLLLSDTRMAGIALRDGGHLLRLVGTEATARLEKAAMDGNVYAALALLEAGIGTKSVERLARERLEAAIAPRVHESGVMTFGTSLPETAALVRELPENDLIRFGRGMVEFANDRGESSHNRGDALVALQVIAHALPDHSRDELVEAVLGFAEGRYEPSRGEDDLPRVDDPLQRFRVSFGPTGLEPVALLTAATLARTPNQVARVQAAALALLPQAEDHTSNVIARALASLPPEEVSLDPGFLAAHAVPSLRALGAVIWARRPSDDSEIGLRLARDPSPLVRRSLAGSLGEDARSSQVRDLLKRDPRRSIRRLVERSGSESH